MGETKIMLVALLLVIIFLGIATFLFYLEKRINKAEKKLKELESVKNQENKQ